MSFLPIKKFQFFGPRLFSRYWSKKNDKLFFQNKKKFGSGSIMIHLAISSEGRIFICEILGKLDTKGFCSILKEKVVPRINEVFGEEKWVLQQDNASIHCAVSSKKFYEKHKIGTMVWPARSPDLNIVENIFGLMSHEIYKKGKVYSNKDN